MRIPAPHFSTKIPCCRRGGCDGPEKSNAQYCFLPLWPFTGHQNYTKWKMHCIVFDALCNWQSILKLRKYAPNYVFKQLGIGGHPLGNMCNWKSLPKNVCWPTFCQTFGEIELIYSHHNEISAAPVSTGQCQWTCLARSCNLFPMLKNREWEIFSRGLGVRGC